MLLPWRLFLPCNTSVHQCAHKKTAFRARKVYYLYMSESVIEQRCQVAGSWADLSSRIGRVLPCLPPTHLGTIPSMFPSAKICDVLCWVAAQLTVISHWPPPSSLLPPHTRTQAHTKWCDFCLVLYGSVGLFYFLFVKVLWAFWHRLRLCAVHASVAKPRHSSLKWSDILPNQHRVRHTGNKHVATHLLLKNRRYI